MILRVPTSIIACLGLFLPSLLPLTAGAAGLQVTVTTTQTNANGLGSTDIGLSLNGEPLAIVPEQTVSLGLGDVLRAEISAFALHESGTSSSFGSSVNLAFILDAGTAMGAVQTSFSGVAEAGPEVAQGSAGYALDCNFAQNGCSAPTLPPFISFGSDAVASTLSLLPNQVTVNNVTTETGRVGGQESVDVLNSVILDRALGSPEGSAFLLVTTLAIFEASASGNGTLELTVTDLTPIPVPAVGWMILPALLLFAGLRRRMIGHA